MNFLKTRSQLFSALGIIAIILTLLIKVLLPERNVLITNLGITLLIVLAILRVRALKLEENPRYKTDAVVLMILVPLIIGLCLYFSVEP